MKGGEKERIIRKQIQTLNVKYVTCYKILKYLDKIFVRVTRCLKANDRRETKRERFNILYFE